MNIYTAPIISLRFSLIWEKVRENISCRLKKVKMATMKQNYLSISNLPCPEVIQLEYILKLKIKRKQPIIDLYFLLMSHIKFKLKPTYGSRRRCEKLTMVG